LLRLYILVAPGGVVQFPGSRILTMLPLIALPVVVVADLGSVAVVQLSVPDDAQEAGRAATQAISFRVTPTAATPQNVRLAFEAASNVAALHRQTVDPSTFTVFKDGSIQLTVSKTAPTMLFKRVPGLRNLTVSKTTTTVPMVRY
jgi:hypothetical protein